MLIPSVTCGSGVVLPQPPGQQSGAQPVLRAQRHGAGAVGALPRGLRAAVRAERVGALVGVPARVFRAHAHALFAGTSFDHGLSAARDACRNATRFPLAQAAPCPCDRYTLALEGDWSECVLERPLAAVTANGRPAPGACGAGTRTRRAACRDKSGALVEPSLCGVPAGLQEEPCLVPCPADCLLSEWTPWGAWVAAGWGDCQLIGTDRARGCGTGDQYRRVRCMRFRPHALPEEVADPYCDPVTQPADVNACHVACPGDCVLSPWSDWSECPKPCEPSRERQRTRSVLRGPASDGEGCPPLIEVQGCRINSTCFTYAWRATAYSSCLPLGGSPCGEGVQARAPALPWSVPQPVPGGGPAHADGEVVLRGLPRGLRGVLLDAVERVAVPLRGCGRAAAAAPPRADGQQPARPAVPAAAAADAALPRAPLLHLGRRPMGRLRPTRLCLLRLLKQVDYLRSLPAPQGAWCGHGTVRREVRCLRDGVTPVEPRLCRREQRRRGAQLALIDDGGGGGDDPAALTPVAPVPRPEELRAQDSCYVPCRGDCHVSEWSRWSHC
ncbi:Uncharacterized protein GBIM_15620, partial [Gryllus bimaculatus]